MSADHLYRPLDISKRKIRLLSFENTAEQGQIHLSLHYVSLNQWKDEYAYFRDGNAANMDRSDATEAWLERRATMEGELHNAIERFTWGDYICLSYTWGDYGRRDATLFLDGVATAVSKHLEVALTELRENLYCQLGMKVWVDALCINQADVADRNIHVLRVKNIFEDAFSVTIWTKEAEDLQIRGLTPPEERLILCDIVLRLYGRKALEELLGVRPRDWGVAGDEDEQLMKLVQGVDLLVFDQYHWADSDDEDEFGFGEQHLRDVVRVELWLMFRKAYWSRLWIIQELAVSPATSTVHWGESTFSLSTLQALGDILLTSNKLAVGSKIWQELKPRLELLAFTTIWRSLNITAVNTERSLNHASIRKLTALTERASCSLPHDHVYGLLGLFPASVHSAVTIDYRREAADVIAEFNSAVSVWAAECESAT